jgi:AcrR family transcriptional regulator
MSKQTAVEAPVSRTTRRQEETRKRLMEAAHILLSQGEEKVSIQAITDYADVGAGTFYNYFAGREEIFDAVVDEAVESLGARLDALTREMTDAAEIYSFSLRHLMQMAISDPVWGWLVVRLGIAHNRLISILGPRAKRDLLIGVKSGRFSIPDIEMATSITFGSLLSAIHTHLENREDGDRSAVYAESMLRMVGIPKEEAKRITALKLPRLPD